MFYQDTFGDQFKLEYCVQMTLLEIIATIY